MSPETAINARPGWLHEAPFHDPLPTPCDDYRPMPGEHGFCGHCGWNGVAHDGDAGLDAFLGSDPIVVWERDGGGEGY